jgi:SAM-dependent methyltransferase
VSWPERIVPGEAEPGVDALHLKRYDFAASWCRDRDVLDAGCGVGYGTARLGETARSVLGVDVSEEAIAYAREHYASGNVSFAVMDMLSLACEEASFDVACAFETIEHVEDARRAVGELARVLRDDGVFVVSTPQVARTTTSPSNPYHRIEFSRADFEALLRSRFESVELYGQRRLQTRRHRLARRLDVLGLRRRFRFLRRAAVVLGTTPTAELTANDIVIEREGIERAGELVGVCTGPRRVR